MANYTKATNFTAKDSLASGDPAKVIKGSEFDTEFDALQTASGTKADKIIPATTGDFAALDINGNLADSGKTPPGGEVVGDTDTQTLTNKTLTSPTLNTPVIAGLTIPDTTQDHNYIFAVSELTLDRNVTLPLLTGDDTFVFEAHTQTLTNKTLTSPTIAGASLSGTLSGSPNFSGSPTVGSSGIVTLTASQALTNKTLTSPTLSGTLGGSVTFSGNNTYSGTATFNSTVTMNGTTLTFGNANTDTATFNAGAVFNSYIEEQQYSLTGTAIDPANGTLQYKTISTTTTFTESLADGEYVILHLTNGGSYTVNWPTMTWIGTAGAAPTLTAFDVIVMWQTNGTVYGAYTGSSA